MLSDPISDMLTRIRNGYLASKKEVVLPSSKLKLRIANLLKEKGFLADVAEQKHKNDKKELKLELLYKEGRAAITQIRRVSKPGRKIYLGVKDLPRAKEGYGIIVVSTSSGVMTAGEAKKLNAGGEVICEVY